VPSLQHGFAELLRIALPGLRMLDDLVRDYIVGNIAAITEPKRYPVRARGLSPVTARHRPAGLFLLEPADARMNADQHRGVWILTASFAVLIVAVVL
jgi:hypothetical protein